MILSHDTKPTVRLSVNAERRYLVGHIVNDRRHSAMLEACHNKARCRVAGNRLLEACK